MQALFYLLCKFFIKKQKKSSNNSFQAEAFFEKPLKLTKSMLTPREYFKYVLFSI